jgi:hypothetical protein
VEEPSRIYIVMAGATYHARLPSAGNDHLDPPWWRASARTAEIPQVAEGVACDPVVCATPLARLRQQALEECGAIVPHCRWVVQEDGALAPLPRHAAPGGHQWLLPLPAFNHDLQALPWAVGLCNRVRSRCRC